MTRRDHSVLTVLAAGGALLTLYQCWYIHLPLDEVMRFDFCRFNKILNCWHSLYEHGKDLHALGLPVFSTLFALFFFQLLLSGFSWIAAPSRREAWLALARLVSFPVSGLAIYVLLNDVMVFKVTSVSAILVALTTLANSVTTVLHGAKWTGIRRGGTATWGLFLSALLAGYLLYGAGSSRREAEAVERDRMLAPASVRYARFAPAIPRRHAASLGDPIAPHEVLLFVDPEQEASRALMREALEIMPAYAERVFLNIYAPGEPGVLLVLAQKRDSLKDYLESLATPPGDPKSVRHIAERQQEAWGELGIDRFPTALWRGGRKSGDFTLREILAPFAAGR
ncbi:MAG: hypothetical protein ACYSX0_04545 [Planctomycetota bacterium]|jgi:hypothetical protein